MSQTGAADIDVKDVADLDVAIVAASWHAEIMEGLIGGAMTVCQRAGARTSLVRVPGSFELAIAAQAAARAGFGAVVALGVVIRGGTPHFDYVCRAATDGLNRVALDTGVPIGFGVLTCDDEQQARDRAGLPGSSEDKGAQAAAAAIQTAVALRGIRAPGGSPVAGFSA